MSGILFDGRWVRPGMTGVGIQAFNMLAAFAKLGTNAGLILNPGPVPPELAQGFRIIRTSVDLTHHPMTELFEQFGIPYLCYRNGYDSFVSFEGRVPVLHFGISTLAYINDLSYLKLRQTQNLKYSILLIYSLMTSRFFASRIIAISKAVKDDLIHILKVSPGRIAVVHCGDSCLDRFPEVPIPNLPKAYFLGVGMTNPRKNLACLLQGFREFREKHPSCSLVLTGHKEWIGSAASGHYMEGVVNLGFVSQGELRFLYRNAAGLVYPSKDEGFGIPLIDAYRNGCPVYCSDIPVFREVMGNYARYFDPESARDLSVKLAMGAPSPAGEIGLPPDYSWDMAALRLLDAIRNP